MAVEQKLQAGQPISAYPEIGFAVDLARKIARAVRPVYGIKQNDVPINDVSHDFSYALDVKAEDVVRKSFEIAWRRGLLYGYVTEDQGMVLPQAHNADWIFLIDPVDGSRPANIGAENACVNIAITRGVTQPTFADIEMGIVLALKEELMYVARAGEGVYQIRSSLTGDAKLHEFKKRQEVTPNLRDCSITFETYSMSNELLGIVIDPLLSEISFKTESPSGSYSTFSVIRGQNELAIDIRRRAVLDFPYLPVMIKEGGKAGTPMDIAPEFLMLRELGMVVTDAYGRSLGDVRLWQFNTDGSWSPENQISLIAAASPTLHQMAMQRIEEGFTNLSQKYPQNVA